MTAAGGLPGQNAEVELRPRRHPSAAADDVR